MYTYLYIHVIKKTVYHHPDYHHNGFFVCIYIYYNTYTNVYIYIYIKIYIYICTYIYNIYICNHENNVSFPQLSHMDLLELMHLGT